MASIADEAIGNVTSAMKRTGIWESTHLILLSDNGGDSMMILQIIYLGTMTSLACTAIGILLKSIFKFGNKKRRRQSTYDRMMRSWYRYRNDKRKRKELKKANAGMRRQGLHTVPLNFRAHAKRDGASSSSVERALG